MRLELTPHNARPVILNRWQSYNLRLNCRGPSSFDVTLPPTRANRALVAKHGGAQFRIFYNGALQFSGLIDERSEATRNEGTDLKITGRDMLGFLSDVAIEPKALRISGKTLIDIAAQWVASWPTLIPMVSGNSAASRYIAAGGGKSGTTSTAGLEKPIYDPTTGKIIARIFLPYPKGGATRSKYGKFGKDSPYYAGVGTETIKTGSVRLGMTILEGLSDLCAQIGVAPMCACDGSLLLFRPCYGFDSTAYGDGLVIRWDSANGRAKSGCTVSAVQLETTIAQRRSVWYISGMGKSKKTSRAKELVLGNGVVKDVSPAFWERATATTLGAEILHKPGVYQVSGVTNKRHLTRAARRHVAESMLSGLSLEYKAAGHLAPSGVLWVPDTTVRVHDERNDIKDTYYIHNVERRFDMNTGTESKISLMPRDIWLGDLDDPSTGDDAWYAGMMRKVWW